MRIFFGATLPESTREKIAAMQSALHSAYPVARLEGKEKLHITLKFIGEFNSTVVDELFRSAADDLKDRTGTFSDVVLTGMKYFPHERLKRGIWLDCHDDGSVAKVAQAIDHCIKKFHVESESRAYKPHITVARIKETDGMKESHFDLQKFWLGSKLGEERFVPQSVALYESIMNPGRSGSEYRILHEIKLDRSDIMSAATGTVGQKGSSRNG